MNCFSGKKLACIRGERNVFSDLSFSVCEGEMIVLKGPNGSGKSSLLRLMAGLLRPAKGELVWNGKSISEEPEIHNQRLHYVGHLNPIKSILTVYENISFWTELRNCPNQINYALNVFGMSHLQNILGKFLSAGQIRQTNLVRLLAIPASLWLLDEPTASLDANAIKALENAIKRYRTNGGIVIASTHLNLNWGNAQILNVEEFNLRRLN